MTVIPITIFPSASLRARPRPIQVLPSNYALSMHVGSTATISQIVIEGSLNLEDASFLNLANRSAYSAQVYRKFEQFFEEQGSLDFADQVYIHRRMDPHPHRHPVHNRYC